MDRNDDRIDNMNLQEPQGLDDDNMIMEDAENRRLLTEYAYIRTRQVNAKPDTEAAWQRFSKRVLEPEKLKNNRRVTMTSIARYAAAAIVACAILTGTYFFLANEGEEKAEVPVAYAEYVINDKGNVVAFEAVNGPRVVMFGNADQRLEPISKKTEDSDIEADKEKAVVKCFPMAKLLNIAKKNITTPRGAMYEVVLSDGTKVHLNTDSKLVFPVQFHGDERMVELEGEAYFEVARDESHPFIVKSPQVTTTVLGTKFNVKSYDDVSATVTLLEGSIKVTCNSKPEAETLLTPNQNVILTKSGDLSTNKVDAQNSIKWTDNKFFFDQTPMMMAMKDMGRWYNVSVEITDETLKFFPISFELSRECGIAEFVSKLNDLGFLNVEYKNNVVYVNMKEDSFLPAAKIKPIKQKL